MQCVERELTDSSTITCDRRIRILDLDVLVTHQCPSGEIRLV